MKVLKKLLTIIFIGTTASLSYNTQAQSTHNQHSQHHQDILDRQELVYEEINLLDTTAMRQLEILEPQISAALELYGDNWNQQFVNPYNAKSMALPDTMTIDLTDYCIPHKGYITSNYGWRRSRMHRGIDIKVQTGDTIRAAFSGKIRLTKYERRGYGYYVIIRHDNGLETIYGHLSKFLVTPDQVVKAGEPIALGGNTGRSTGSHLHFETRYLGMDINPNAIFDFTNQTLRTDFLAFSPSRLASTGPSAIHVDGTKYGKNKGKSTGSSGTAYYRVKKGDTLSRIAQRNGTSVSRICRLNGINKNSVLRPGQRLRIR